MTKAMCIVTKDVEEEPSFHSVVIFNEETSELAIKRMQDEGFLSPEEDVEYFLVDSAIAKKLRGVEFPDYVSRDDVGDIWMNRLMLEVCRAFEVEAEPEDIKPKCPACGSETIVMIVNRESIYAVNSARIGEYEGKAELEPDDIDLVKINENENVGDTYRCTTCKFENENLTTFNPN